MTTMGDRPREMSRYQEYHSFRAVKWRHKIKLESCQSLERVFDDSVLFIAWLSFHINHTAGDRPEQKGLADLLFTCNDQVAFTSLSKSFMTDSPNAKEFDDFLSVETTKCGFFVPWCILVRPWAPRWIYFRCYCATKYTGTNGLRASQPRSEKLRNQDGLHGPLPAHHQPPTTTQFQRSNEFHFQQKQTTALAH
jgi:hypothetical protein